MCVVCGGCLCWIPHQVSWGGCGHTSTNSGKATRDSSEGNYTRSGIDVNSRRKETIPNQVLFVKNKAAPPQLTVLALSEETLGLVAKTKGSS